MENITENYRQYKWFFTSTGVLVIGGKNSVQNDALLKKIQDAHKEYIIMHTAAPGSPFTIFIASPEKVTTQDIKECAIFTGALSKAWKSGKKKTNIHIFKASQIYKEKHMAEGTWGVIKSVKTMEVPLELALTKQKGVLRAVPPSAAKKKLAKITPGKIEKKDLVSSLQKIDPSLSQEEILAALPAGGLTIK